LIDQTTALHEHQQVETIRASRLEAWALLMQALGGGWESTTENTFSSPTGGADRHAT
jgi:outer membrane protein TolC